MTELETRLFTALKNIVACSNANADTFCALQEAIKIIIEIEPTASELDIPISQQ